MSAPEGSRRSIRRSVELRCELIGSRVDEPVSYRLTDLSADGLWISTREPVRAGETVVVCFEPSGWDAGELMVFAEVARVTSARPGSAQPGLGMGLEFTDLTPKQRCSLELWLRSRRAPIPRRRRPVLRVSSPMRWR